ncbi:hypothetical protein BV20DRAFT_972525 [Pilatotrama ljubarskyi]|nr:hypothetical protein BV20DRAFT_972525 [Pilatotrama ljubarskyi]
MNLITLLGPSIFASLRVYALSGKNKLLCGITLLLSASPFLGVLSTIFSFTVANFPPPINCTYVNTVQDQHTLAFTLIDRLTSILADCLVVTVTWYASYKHLGMLQGALRKPSLNQVLLENGSLYFLVFLSLNVLDIAFDSLQITVPAALGQENYVTVFIDPLNSILTSRFLLDLRAVEHKLVAGGSSISLGSIQFAGADIQSGQPQPFLSLTEDSAHLDENNNEKATDGLEETPAEVERVESGGAAAEVARVECA